MFISKKRNICILKACRTTLQRAENVYSSYTKLFYRNLYGIRIPYRSLLFLLQKSCACKRHIAYFEKQARSKKLGGGTLRRRRYGRRRHRVSTQINMHNGARHRLKSAINAFISIYFTCLFLFIFLHQSIGGLGTQRNKS